MAKPIALGRSRLQLDQLVALAEADSQAALPASVRSSVRRSRKLVESAVRDGEVVYGVNTGFGKLAGVSVDADRLGILQRNLLLSHATGVGVPFDQRSSRLALALRIHTLAQGCSGVRLELLEAMLRLFNAGLVPEIPSQGSVGASGDLAPLAHMALPLIGHGRVHLGAKVISGAEAMKRVELKPLTLAAKEGLALINGTQIMTAVGLLALQDARRLSQVADVCCALSVEALRGSSRPFGAAVHRVRPHVGQGRSAANLRSLLSGSKIQPSHRNCGKVQDAYSLRCAPQVHGAAKDAIRFATGILLTEASSVTDNPLILPTGTIVSAGNFHGQPVSQALDFLKIAVSTLANISERRVENMVNPDISGLPPFLAAEPGIESGLMIPQVVAAALASENKTLAHPASVDSIPTSANREDHVSMGVTAARHAVQVVSNTAKVLGIELITGAAALDCSELLRPGRGVEPAVAMLREVVPPLVADRFLAPDLAAAETLVLSPQFVSGVEAGCGRALHAD